MSDRTRIELVDCTLRDGSYQIDFGFTAERTREMVASLERAGIGWIEAGHGLGLGAPASGKVKSAESDLAYLTAARTGAKSARVGVFAMPAFAGEDDVWRAADCGMDFIRIGMDAGRFQQGETLVRQAVKLGMHTTAFLMKSYTLSLTDLQENAHCFEDWGAEAVAIVDSAGGMIPDQVGDYVDAVHTRTSLAVAFHGHDNLRLACGNALAAAAAGATMLDASLKGLGRSSGNAQIEALAAALTRAGYRVDADPLALSDLAERYVTDPGTHSGITAVDLVQGMALVHSGMQERIDRAAAIFNLDPALLTLAVGEAGGGLDLAEEAVMQVAEAMTFKARVTGRAAG